MDDEAFANQVHIALEHLHDPGYLLNLPLTAALALQRASREEAARELRSALLAAISKLDPDLQSREGARELRGYTILFGRYVQGMTTEELMEELSISLRQLRREEKRAFDAVVTILWDRFQPLLGPATRVSESSPAQTEMQQLFAKSQVAAVDLEPILDGILETLAPLIKRHAVQFVREKTGHPLPIQADRVAVRQAILAVFLQSLAGLTGGKLSLDVNYRSDRDYVVLDLYAGPYSPPLNQAENRLAMSQDLVFRQGGRFQTTLLGACWHTHIELPLAKGQINVLVIDDNQALIELFRRYTAGTPYQITSASSGLEALAQVSRQVPHLITLDVMMPQRDGWEILQHLRTQPELAAVPIIVCSVVNEPDLAAMLGASDFLPKPVTQDALLSMLAKWTASSLH